MAKYTTGEVARLCGVSVRTVQYYDERALVIPSELSEGGRRLYSDDDLNKMKIVCFLRELELSIDDIKRIFCDENADEVISLLLEEQERALHEEISFKQSRAEMLAEAKRTLKRMPQISSGSLGDVAHLLENKRQIRRLRISLLLGGILMDAIQISTILLWIFAGIWWPFALGMTVTVIIGVILSVFYFKSTAYICPGCHKIFKAKLSDSFWARHTPSARMLTCVHCGRRGYCIETVNKKREEK